MVINRDKIIANTAFKRANFARGIFNISLYVTYAYAYFNYSDFFIVSSVLDSSMFKEDGIKMNVTMIMTTTKKLKMMNDFQYPT